MAADEEVNVIIRAAYEELISASRQAAAETANVSRSMTTLAASFERAAASARVYFNSVSPSALSAVNRELQTQIALTRQLGERASTFASESKSQLDTRLSVLRAESEAMRRAYRERVSEARTAAAEEERASRERFAFQQRAAPSANIAAHRQAELQFQRDLYDMETARYTRQAEAQRAAAAAIRQRLADEERAVRVMGQAHLRTMTMAPGGAYTRVAFDARAGQFKPLEEGLRRIGTSGSVATREVGHLTAIFDELMRGNFRQVISSIGAAFRDANFGAAALAGTVGALAVTVGGIAFERMIARFADLAVKERDAAAEVGMGIETYSHLRAEFDMVSASGTSFSSSLAMLASRAQEALANPMSKAAGGFATAKIGMDQLKQAMEDPAQMLDLLRQRWQQMGASMLRTDTFRAMLGRGFASLIPYLNMTDQDLARVSGEVDKAGNYFTGPMSDALAQAHEKVKNLGAAFEGLENQLTLLSSSGGFTDWLTNTVEWWSNAVKYVREYNEELSKMPQPSDKIAARMAATQDLYDPNTGMTIPGSAFRSSALRAEQPGAARFNFQDYARERRTGGLATGGALASVATPSADISDINAEFHRRLNAWLSALSEGERAAIRVSSGFATSGHAPGSAHYSGLAVDSHGLSEHARQLLTAYGLHEAVPGDFGHIEPIETPSAGVASAATRRAMFAQLRTTGLPFWPGPGHASQYGVGGAISPGSDTPQTFTAVDPGAQKRAFDQAVKHIEDLRKIRDSQDREATAVAEANHNRSVVAEIQQRRAAFDAQQAREEAAVREGYAKQLEARGLTADSPEVKAALDSTNAEVRANAANAEAIKATGALRDESIRKQITALEAQKATTRNTQEQLVLDQRIAALQAKLDPSRGALVIAQGQARAQQEQVSSLERAYATQQRVASMQERITSLEASKRDITPTRAAGLEIQQLTEQFNALSAILEKRQQLATSLHDTVELDKIHSQQQELVVGTTEKLVGITKQLRAEQEKVVQAWGAPFKTAVDQIGSSLEKTITDLVLMRGSTQNIMRTLYQSFISSTISLGGSILSKAAASPVAGLIGYQGDTAGKGVGDIISSRLGDIVGNWIGKQVGNLIPNVVSSTASGAITTAPIVAAITAQSAAMPVAIATPIVTALTAGNAAIVGALQEVAAVSAANFAKPSVLGTTFEHGGIVPSAAGGWAIPNFGMGARPALVHAQEMVLPAHISKWVQSAAANGRGGGTGDVHVHVGTGATFLDGAGFQRWFNNNGGREIVAEGVRGALRSNAITARNFGG